MYRYIDLDLTIIYLTIEYKSYNVLSQEQKPITAILGKKIWKFNQVNSKDKQN